MTLEIWSTVAAVGTFIVIGATAIAADSTFERTDNPSLNLANSYEWVACLLRPRR